MAAPEPVIDRSAGASPTGRERRPGPVRRRIVLAGGAASAAAGLAALFGWFLGLPALTRLDPSFIPMAPSTALLLVLDASLVLLLAVAPPKPWVFRLRIVAGAGGAAAAATLLILSSSRVYLRMERLWLSFPAAPGEFPLGHISPATALCLVIAGLALLALPRAPGAQPSSARGSLSLAWALIIASGVLLLAYLFGAPVLYSGPFIPPAATTSAALLALGTALAALAWPPSGEAAPPDPEQTRGLGALLFGFVALSAGVVMLGLFTYRHFERRYRLQLEQQLSAIAELRVSELVRWRRELLADAAAFFANPAFSSLVRRALSPPGDPAASRLLRRWLEEHQIHEGYSRIALLDTEGIERVAAPAAVIVADIDIGLPVAEHLRGRRIAFLDFHRHRPGDAIRLGLLVPLYDHDGGGEPLGLLALSIDPADQLYPSLQSWPTPSRTAETLLVRGEGSEVVFLNELRFRKHAALALRLPLDRTDTPAVSAVLGRRGIMEGVDYRGVRVVADVRPVPDSPWALVTRMDVGEVYAPLRERLWLTVASIATLLLGACAGLVLLWRQRTLGLFRERAWLRIVIARSLNEIYVFDAGTLRFIFANDGACRNLGYTAEELLTMTPVHLKPGFTAESFTELVRPLREGTKPVLSFEAVHRRKDGSEYPAEVHLQLVDSGSGPVFLAVVNDITQRTRADAELRERNAELERFIYTVSHDLKSPLVTVKTFLGFLEQDLARADAERIDADVRYMRTAVDKMGGLLEDLLEMSRIGRVVAAPVSVSFAELAAEAVALVAGGIAARGVAVEIDPVEIALHGDRARLVEIWQNLLENAVKFMGDQREPRIRIGAQRREGGVVFSVRDNGSGIDPRYREKIFGLFERLDPAVEGTGLGLALVKRIVELYGGTIRAESEGQGRGAAFLFTLPGALVKPGPEAGGAREAFA